MSVALLADLREPPVIGRFYMVPVVRFPWNASIQDWPVAGPLHKDTDFFSLEQAHYHLDPRFFTKRQAAFVANQGSWRRLRTDDKLILGADDIALAVGSQPLCHRVRDLPKGLPKLARRKCRTSAWPTYAFGHKEPILALNAAFPNARPIERKDGRRLCPHRKFDLSQLVPDADGFVTCPLHGLRVQCAAITTEARGAA